MFSCLPDPTAPDAASTKPCDRTLSPNVPPPPACCPKARAPRQPRRNLREVGKAAPSPKSGAPARLSLQEQIDLANQCIAGSESACTDLYERFVGVVRARLLGVYGIPMDDVDDVAQAVFEKLFRDLALYNRTNPVTTFLFLKVREAAGDYRRQQDRRKEVLTETGDLPFGDEATEAAMPLVFRALLEAVCSCGAKPHMILTVLFVHFLRYGYEDFVGDTELRGMPFSLLLQVFRRDLRCGLPADDRLWLDDCLVPLGERLLERTRRVYVEPEYDDLRRHHGDVLVGDLYLDLFLGSDPVGDGYDWTDKVKRAARKAVIGPTAARRPRKRQKAPEPRPKDVREFTGRPDYPACLQGQFVAIGEHRGVAEVVGPDGSTHGRSGAAGPYLLLKGDLQTEDAATGETPFRAEVVRRLFPPSGGAR